MITEMRRLLAQPGADPQPEHRRRPAPGGQGRRPGPLAERVPELLQPLVLDLGAAGPGPGRRAGRRAGRPRRGADGRDRRPPLARGRAERAQLTEIRKLKARVEAERLPRGANPAKHTKLGPGGIADVEWTVQLLQLQHAHRIPALRSSQTIVALRAARDAGVIDADGRRSPRGGVDPGQPDPQPDHADARPRLGLPAQRQPGAGRAWRSCSATRPGSPPTCWPTTGGSPAGRADRGGPGVLGTAGLSPPIADRQRRPSGPMVTEPGCRPVRTAARWVAWSRRSGSRPRPAGRSPALRDGAAPTATSPAGRPGHRQEPDQRPVRHRGRRAGVVGSVPLQPWSTVSLAGG